MDKYYNSKPKVIEYKLWSSIFYNREKHKNVSKGKRYVHFHRSLLHDMSFLYNKNKRIFMSANKLNKLINQINDKYSELENRFWQENVKYSDQEYNS